MKHPTLSLMSAALLLLICTPTIQAEVSATEAAKLGKSLTPMGAEQAGNASKSSAEG